MKITVSVKPNSKKEGVVLMPDGSYVVRVNVPPVDGKANLRVQILLAAFFDVPKSAVQLTSGPHSKKKVFNIG